MPEQDVKAGELNKAEEVLGVVLPSGDKAAEVVHPSGRAVPLSSADDCGVACVRPESDFGAVGSSRSVRCRIRQRVVGRARRSRRPCLSRPVTAGSSNGSATGSSAYSKGLIGSLTLPAGTGRDDGVKMKILMAAPLWIA